MRTVILTGFEPFLEHNVNSSWEAVKLLPTLNTEEELNIRLIVKEIPVSYEQVNAIVPKLWELYTPDLVIHCGVSSSATSIVMESNAGKTGYFKYDNDDNQLENGVCVLGIDYNIKTELDLEQILKDAKLFSVDLEISNNANKYLCEYIYYVSLSINKQRTLFLHIPTLSEIYTAEHLAKQIKVILRLLLEQLDNVQYHLGDNNYNEMMEDLNNKKRETDSGGKNEIGHSYHYDSDDDSDESGNGKLIIVENQDEIPDGNS